jgi:drug/metabolite transporter (DMT)-like permease
MAFLIHVWGGVLPPTEIVFFRALFALVTLGPFAFRDRNRLVSKDAMVLWLRSIVGAVSGLCFTWNLQHTSVGLANVLFNLAPLGVIVFGWISRSEKPALSKMVCLVLVVSGSFIFWFNSQTTAPALVLAVGLGGALAAAASYTALKHASMRWNPLTLAWAFSFAGFPVSLIFKNGAWVPLRLNVGLGLLSIVFLATLTQILLALSFKWADLSIATAIIPSSMGWGVALDVASGEPAGGKQIVGCLVYLLGTVRLVTRRSHQKQIEFNPSHAILDGGDTSVQNDRQQGE